MHHTIEKRNSSCSDIYAAPPSRLYSLSKLNHSTTHTNDFTACRSPCWHSYMLHSRRWQLVEFLRKWALGLPDTYSCTVKQMILIHSSAFE